MGDAETVLRAIPGGEAVLAWFGRVPRFHDAELRELALCGRSGRLCLHAWSITEKVDASGHFLLDKHALVTMTLEAIHAADLTDSDMVPAIVLDFAISRDGDGFRLAWSSSYGAEGVIKAGRIALALQPGGL